MAGPSWATPDGGGSSGVPGWALPAGGAQPTWATGSQNDRATWATGGQRGSIDNGWNTPFYETMFKQREESDKRKENVLERDDFTGVITYDDVVVTRTGQKRNYKVGDVYQDGQRVENVYDYGKDKGNAILAQLQFDAKEQQKLYQDAEGDQDKIETAIRSRAGEQTAAATAARQQKAFVDEREQIEDQWGAAAPIAIALGGAAAGGITGGGLGAAVGAAGGGVGAVPGAVIGGLIGGAVGGVGALLNQDELIDRAAEAQVKLNKAAELENPLLTAATAVGEYAGAAAAVAQPITNLGVGAVEFFTPDERGVVGGNVGDDESAREESFAQDNLMLEGLRFGTAFADAFAQFASGPGSLLYTVPMAGQLAGGVGTLATGMQWDDRLREFNPIADSGNAAEDVGRWAASIGAVGIDAIQTFTPVGVLRAAERVGGAGSRVGTGIGKWEQSLVNQANSGSKTAETVTKLLGIDTAAHRTIGGRTFNMDGSRVVSVSRTPNITLLAPSEATGWMSVRAKAMLNGAQGKAVTAEDLYAAALQMRELPPVKKALLTGFGESNEEVAQSFLENWAGGYQPSFEELARAAASGFVVGAGMSAGANVGRNPAMQGFADVNAARVMMMQEPLSREEWMSMSAVDRERARVNQPAIAAVAAQARQDMAEDQTDENFNSHVLRQVMDDQAIKVLEAQMQRGLPAGERTWKIAGIGNPEVPSDVVRVELQALLQALTTHAQVYTETGREASGAALTQLLQAGQEILARVIQNPELAAVDVTPVDYQRPDGSVVPAGTNSVEAVNSIFKDAWDGAYGADAQAALELVFQRSPSDNPNSWVMLRPEIDTELTRLARPGEPIKAWFVNHAVLKGLSGDFDGDGTALRSFLNLDESEAARTRLRLGLTLQAEDTVVIDSYAGELAYSRSIMQHPDALKKSSHIQKTLGAAVDAIAELLNPDGEFAPADMRQSIKEHLLDPLLQGHSTDAKQLFWQWLSTTDLVENAAFKRNERILFRINDIWVQSIFRVGTTIAIERGAKPLAAWEDIPELDPTSIPSSDGKRKDTEPAATLGQTAQRATTGNDDIRVKQKFNYSPLASQTMDAETGNQLIAWAQKLYRILSSGTTRTQADLATRVDEPAAYARQSLQRLLDDFNLERAQSGITTDMTIADFARVQVTDVDLLAAMAGQALVNGEPISYAQLALRDAVQRYEALDRQVLDVNDGELRRKYALLKGMDMKDAAREIFKEGFPMPGNRLGGLMEELVGLQIATHMDWVQKSLGDVIAEYSAMGRKQRHQYVVRAKSLHAAYGDSHSTEKPASPDTVGEVSAFRTFMDIIETEGNLFVTMGDNGLASTNTQLGSQDADAIDSLQTSATALRNLFLESSQFLGQRRHELRREGSRLTVEQVQMIFDMDTTLATRVAELIPQELALTVFTTDSSGRVHAPRWFYEFFVEENAELAAFQMWRGMLIAQMNNEARLKRGVSQDRLVALYQLLADADPSGRATARFEQALADSKSIREFLKFVNLNLNGDNAPQMAIIRDQVTFDLNFSKGGWQRSGSQSTLKKAIQALRDQITQSAKNLDTTLRNEQKDDEFLYKLQLRDATALSQVEKAITRARSMPSGTGPKALLNSMLALAIGFTGNESEKAKTARGTESIGHVTMLQQASWGTPLNQLMAAWTSLSEMDALARPDRLLDPMTFWLQDGTPIEWPGLTADLVVELSQDRAMRPLLLAALGPTTFDQSVEEGQSSLQSLIPSSFNDIIADPQGLKQILSGQSFQDYMRFGSMIDAKLGENALLFFVSKIFAARTSGANKPLNEKEYLQWVEDAFVSGIKLLRSVALVPSTRRDEVKRLLDEMRPQAFLKDSLDPSLTPTEAAEMETLNAAIELAFQDERIGLTGADLALVEARQMRIMDTLKANTAGQALVKAYTIPKDKSLQHEVKLRLWQEAHDRGNFWSYIQGPDAALAREFLGWSPSKRGYPSGDHEKEWEALSRALLVYKLGGGSGQVTATPEARATMAIDDADFRLFLGDWNFLYDFADPVDGDFSLWNAATEVTQDLKGEQLAGTNEADFVELVRTELFENPNYPLGAFSTTVIQTILNAKNRAVQSPAEAAIGMYGSNPALNVTLATATRYTIDNPDGVVPPRVWTFDSSILRSRDAKGDSIPLTIEDVYEARDFGNGELGHLGMLQGRFVKSLVVTLADGTPVEFDKVKPTRKFTGVPGAELTGLRATSPGQIANALKDMGLEETDVTITVEFFHPYDRPSEPGWENNLFFDGVPSGSGADAGIALVASDQQTNGQTQAGSRRALDALKKAKAALINPELPSRLQVAGHENPEDMAATIEYKVQQIMMSDRDVSLLGPSAENRVRKQLLVQTIVRGIDEQGVVRVFSANDLIALQRQGKDPFPVPLTKAQVVTIPRDFLLDLLGEQGEKGTRFNLDPKAFSLTLKTWDNWKGRWDENELLQNLPGLFDPASFEFNVETFKKKSLFARTAFLKVSRPLRLSSTRELAKFDGIIDTWSAIQRDRGIDARVNDANVAGIAQRLSNENLQTAADWEKTDAQAPAVSARRMRLPDDAGLSSDTQTRMQKLLDQAQDHLSIETTLAITGTEMVWKFDRNDKRGPTFGNLRSIADINYNAKAEHTTKGINPMPGDFVLVDPSQIGFEFQDLITLLEGGYRVRLTGRADARRAIATATQDLLDTGRFVPRNGSWELRNPRSGSQTAISRESSLLAIRTRKTDRFVGVFADKHLEGEQAAYIVDPEALRNREVAVMKTLVQSNAFPGFQRPGTPESVAAVRKYLDLFSDPVVGQQWVEHLAKISGTTTAKIRPFIERAIQHTDRFTGLWKTIESDGTGVAHLKIGDFVFLVNADNQVIITRHGHKPFKTDDNGEALLSMLDNGNVAIFTDELDDAPTFYEGPVNRWELGEKGLVAEMRLPLSALADKMIFTDDGLKIFGNALANAGFDVTRLQINDTIPLSYIISLADHVSKEGSAIDNASSAIEYLGFDMTEAYARTFLGIQQDEWDIAVSEFKARKPEKYQDIRARVRGVFEAYQSGWRNTTLSALDAQAYVELLSGNFPNLNSELLLLLAQTPKDAQDRVLDGLDNGVTPELRVTLAALAYLGTPGASIENILSTSGVETGETKSMPEVFTGLFETAGQGSPLRKWFFKRLNDRLPHRVHPDGSLEGYHLREQDFMMEIRTPGQPMREGLFSYKEAHSTGSDNGAIFAQSFEHSATQGASLALRNMAVLALYGADAGHSPQLDKFRDYLEGRAFDASSVQGLGQIFQTVQKRYIPPVNKSTLATPAEILHEKIGQYNVEAFSQPILKEGEERGWTPQTKEQAEQRARRLFSSVGLPADEWLIIDGWIRRYLWRPKEADATPEMAEFGHVSWDAWEAAFQAIEKNLLDGRYPTWLADVPMMTADEVGLFIQAYKKTGKFIPDPQPWGKKRQSMVDAALRGRFKDEAFEPREKGFDPRTLQGKALHDYFYEAALGEGLSSPISSLNQNAVDGFLQTYKPVFEGGGSLPTSMDPLVRLQLLDPDFNNIVLSLDKNYRQYLKVVPLKDVVDMRVQDVFGGTLLEGKYARSYLGKDEIAKTEQRQAKWRKERGIADSYMQGQQVNARGHVLRTNEATTNAAMRVLMNIRLANGMFHPWLFISAPLETAVRNTFESAVTILTGENFGKIGQLHRNLDDRIRASNFGQSAIVRALNPEVKTTLTAEVLVQAEDTVTSLSHNPAAISMIHQDLYEGRHDPRAGKVERFTERMVRIFGKWQDPSYGITPKASAQRIVGAVLRYFDEVGTENNRGVDEALALLSRSPQQFRREHPVAYTLALNSLANARTVKATSFSLFTRSIIDPLSNHVNPLINIPSNLMLKIPFAFQNYAFNVATNMLGLQGLDSMLALLLQGRQSGKAWGHLQAAMSGQRNAYDARVHGVDYLGNVLESVNFADAFIRAGMTHTALAGLALVLGGLAGGDEEEKKRRRREEMLGVGHVYDPRDFENDWRNADAVYLDGIPFLEQLFGIKQPDGTVKAPAELHWTLKQFISPIVGISKFGETGNFNHIIWGFGDALGSMPLINAMDWNDAVTTSEVLWQKAMDAEAAAENGADETLLAAAMQFTLDGVARLERMLFENAFINSLYVAKDKYDRDPWVLPDVDADGIIQRDNLGQPMETSAMNEYVNEFGEAQLGTVSREDLFGQLRSYTERRATLATFLSLFSGLGDSEFYRENMAVRTYDIEKQAADPEQIEQWILSEWDNNSEVLTNDGAEAFLKSIHAGYIKEDSQVLDNIYLTFEQRKALTDRFQSQIIQQSYDEGLTEEEAYKRWNDIWYGTDDNPWATPLFDVVWSKNTHADQIPYTPTQEYRQLNTTFVLGPDGKPWATGITRGELYNFFGQAPLNAYSGAGKGDVPGNLGIDERLNSTDEVGNLNTGMRSLEKVNRTTDNPTDEDILKAIDEVSREIRDGIRGPSYNRDGGGYARYFGGGGGGGGYSSRGNPVFMPFLNDMKQPYIDNVPSVYGGEPRVQRSSIKRTRFSSERGRLNQWQ